MTLSLAGSPAVINLMPLTTAHYEKHLICCKVLCVGKNLERDLMQQTGDVLSLSVLCKPRTMLLPPTKWNQNEICHDGALH